MPPKSNSNNLPRRRARGNEQQQQQQNNSSKRRQLQSSTVIDHQEEEENDADFDSISIPELVNISDSEEISCLRTAQLQKLESAQARDSSRQNGCLIRPQRILSSKRFEISIRNANKNKQRNTNEQEDKPESNAAFFKRQTDQMQGVVNQVTTTREQQQAAAATAMMKKVVASSYGHGTNGVRVVNGKLKTLVVSWLGALEGSHFGHLLRREYFGSSAFNSDANGTLLDEDRASSGVGAKQKQQFSSTLFAEPASRRALCCIAVRYNKGYAEYIERNKHIKKFEDRPAPTQEDLLGKMSPFQVVGVLSMEEPVLELNFPDEDGEEVGGACAGIGTEIAVFYTPGLILGFENPSADENNNNANNRLVAQSTMDSATPSAVIMPALNNSSKVLNNNNQNNVGVNDPTSENYNPMVTPNGELRCSLCVEMTYTSVDNNDQEQARDSSSKTATTGKKKTTSNKNSDDGTSTALKVQESSLLPHDDNSWTPLRTWVAQMIRDKKKRFQDELDRRRAIIAQNKEASSNKNNNDKDKEMMMPKPQQLTSPLFGALRSPKSQHGKTKSVIGNKKAGGDDQVTSGMDYDSTSSSSDDDDDDDDDVVDDGVDLKNFKLMPGSDAAS